MPKPGANRQLYVPTGRTGEMRSAPGHLLHQTGCEHALFGMIIPPTATRRAACLVSTARRAWQHLMIQQRTSKEDSLQTDTEY